MCGCVDTPFKETARVRMLGRKLTKRAITLEQASGLRVADSRFPQSDGGVHCFEENQRADKTR